MARLFKAAGEGKLNLVKEYTEAGDDIDYIDSAKVRRITYIMESPTI